MREYHWFGADREPLMTPARSTRTRQGGSPTTYAVLVRHDFHVFGSVPSLKLNPRS